MRRLQTVNTRPNTKRLVAIGDSLTLNFVYGHLTPPTVYYPTRLAVALQALSVPIMGANYGISGQTSTQMLSRVSGLYQFGTPDLAVIWAGHNDRTALAITSITSASTTATVTTTAAHYLATGMQVTIAGATQTEYNGTYTVTVTGATTFTYTFAGSATTPATGTKTYTIPYAQTTANIKAMAEAVLADGCERVVICSTHYLNYGSGGDSTATPASGARLDLWNAQSTAYTDEAALHSGEVAFCDLYAYFYALLGAGTYVQGDHLWHQADSDVHLNAAGEQIVADALLATIQAQSGWLTALQS
jgi:lysophospholipase L1-like esterase